MAYKKWTETEIAWLRENWENYSPLSLSIKLGRSESSVKWKYCVIKGPTVRIRWKRAEVDWLRANYMTHSMAEMVQYLGRTAGTIKFKAQALGIAKKRIFKNQTS